MVRVKMSRSLHALTAALILGVLPEQVRGQDAEGEETETTTPEWTPEKQSKIDNTYYFGNAVPRRNVPPPTDGCTVTGKVFTPLSPDPSMPYSKRISWDWCQNTCENTYVADPFGTVVKCTHFAFYPDGKCYLQGQEVVLETDTTCNTTDPCEHGFQVISGPASCDNSSNWVIPPGSVTEAPTTTTLEETTTVAPVVAVAKRVAEGEECNGSLPPQFATLCEDGLYCAIEGDKKGAPGVCKKMEISTTAQPEPKVVGKGEECNASLPPQFATLCEEGLMCLADTKLAGAPGVCTEKEKDVPVIAPVTVKEPTVAPPPTTPTATTTTMEPPPTPQTIIGYYYTPHMMEGSVKTLTPSWRACMELCASNPYCEHFGYWPDGGCLEQGNNVTLKKAVCNATETECEGQKVISGPRDLSEKDLWPKLESNEPAAVVPVIAPVAVQHQSPSPSSREVDVDGPVQKSEGGGGVGPGLIAGLVILLVGGGGVGAYGYNQGWFGSEEGASDDDVEQDVEDGESSGMRRPLAAE